MCRIAGIINPSLNKEALSLAIHTMTKVLAHGGPDAEGHFIDTDNPIALGHRRLSLLDLSPLGHQPMLSADSNVILVFNGEVYNFKEIKSELLAKNYTFKSTSDTEVILNAYTEWGINAFNILKGMYAFCIYDKLKNKVFLIRDIQGIKPLYIYQHKNILAFSSEVKAFKALNIPLTEEPQWEKLFLSFGHLPEPFTTYKEVKMLRKGHFLEIDLNADICIKEHRMAKTVIQPINVTATEAQLLVNTALDNAINKQLVADAPIGVFLSGGIDSSLLALQAAKYKQEQLISISVNFPEAKFTEKKYQKIVSSKLKGKHLEKEITKNDFNHYFQHIIQNMDQPSVDGINSWFVSKIAHDAGLKAVLSGIGADELFGGYPSFKRIDKLPLISKFAGIISALANTINKDALARAIYLKQNQHTAFEYLFLRGFFSPKQLKQFFNISKTDVFAAITSIPENSNPIPTTFNGKRAAWHEQNYFMQNQLLKDADAMSMLHGLEVRVPFLDDDLVNLVNSLPNDILYAKDKPAKHLLIHAFNNILPQEIWNRPKMGFTFPFQEWLKEHPLYLSVKAKHQHTNAFSSFFSAYEKGQIHWSKIMSLIVLENFRNKN